MITFTGEDKGIELDQTRTTLIVIPTNLTERTGLGLVALANRLCPDSETQLSFSEAHALAVRKKWITKTKGACVGRAIDGAYLYSLPVKTHPAEKASLRLIESQMRSLTFSLVTDNWHINEVRVPKIGSGLGRLRWGDVYACIEPFLMRLDEAGYRVVVYSEEMEA
jgi:hypothetical protein